MRQCEQCKYYSPDTAPRCARCGASFIVARMAATTTQAPGQPPEPPRKRRYTRLIPGISPFSLLRRDPQTGQLGCGPGCFVSTILVAILALGGFLLLQQQHPSTPSVAQANLSVSGNVVPGGSMQIHGRNFPASSTVEITVDDSSSASRSTIVSASVGGPVLWGRQLRTSDHSVTVKSDGTFDTTFSVPSTWTPGSYHTIRAATQNVQASTQASIDVVIQPSKQTPTPSPTPTQTPTPTPTPTQTPTPTPTPVPSVSGITPGSGPTNGGISITITGSGFKGTTSVEFGSASATDFKVNDDKHITVVSPAESSFDAPDKPVDVTVTTPNGTSQTSRADQFTYTALLPIVSSVDPSGGSSTGGTPVTINGTGFTGATRVAFGSAIIQCSHGGNCTINSDGTQLTVTSPAESSSDASGKPVDVRVTTPNGTSKTNDADQFTYTLPLLPPPVVLDLDKSSGPASGGTTVTIIGSGFTNATGVSFGSTAATSFNEVSDKQITAVSPAGSSTVHVRVTTPNGTSKTSRADHFTYMAPPVVSGLDQSSGPASGGTTVKISGTGFTGAISVKFGSATVTCGDHSNCMVDSDTQITVISPAESSSDAPGPVDVTVTTSSGTSATTSADHFTYTAPPVVTSLDPSSGPEAGGTKVTITGTDFTSATAVSFGSAAGTSVDVVSDTQITAVSPAGSGTVDVTVITPNGTSKTSSADHFTYTVPLPVVNKISPASGAVNGGDTVIITGTGFTGATRVAFGAAKVDCKDKPCIINKDGTQLTVTSPAESSSDALGPVDVTVTTAAGTSAHNDVDKFTYEMILQ